MDNGFSTSDAVLTAAMSGGGFGRGGGIWGGGYYGSPFANDGSNAVRLNRNGQFIENQADCTREVLGRSIDANTAAFENLTRQNQFNRLCDRLVDSEFRTGDRLRDLQSEINENARRAAECCCETQKEILKLDASNNLKFAELSAGQATILERLSANKEISELRAQLQTKDIFATCGCGCGGGVRPCPPVV